MNFSVTKITIPTDQLRALLPEEALVELQGIAIEKIAEELRRKTTGDKLEELVKGISQKIADNCRENFTRSYRFPEEAKRLVRDLVQTAVADSLRFDTARAIQDMRIQMERIVAKAAADITAQSVKAVQQYVDGRAKDLDAYISAKARTEFLATIKEAKGAGL